MRCRCPNCSRVIVQTRNVEGLNFCPECRSLFYIVPRSVPPWVLGVVAVLACNWLRVLAG